MFTALIIVVSLCLCYISIHWVYPRVQRARPSLVKADETWPSR
jgi:hypothetical protein